MQNLASPVALRCARIRAARGMDSIPAMFIGLLAGMGVFGALLLAAVSISTAPLGGSPGASLQAIAKGISPARVSVYVASITLLAFLMPPFLRWVYDRSTQRQTREWFANRKRSERRAKRVLIVIAVLVILMLATMAVLVAWQAAVVPAAILCAKYGGMMLGVGLRARRGAHTVCARCDYPMGSWRAAPAQCPECGNAWKEPWRARFGQRGVNVRAVSVGLFCMAVAGLLLTALGVWGLSRP